MAELTAGAVARRLPSAFKLGQKEIFLPKHVITLLRRPKNPPHWATFKVPLRFTKFDIRDYLWNLYGVETTAVRSNVTRKGLERRHGGLGALFRPPPSKYMTVEMTRPFVWPDSPEDLEPWNKKLWDAREQGQREALESQKERQRGHLEYRSRKGMDSTRKKLREQAEMLLKGEVKWDNGEMLDVKWRDKVEGKETKEKKA